MKSDDENIRSGRVNAIAIALEVKHEKCLKLIEQIKLTENELGEIKEIKSDKEYQKCEGLLNRFDTLRKELTSESKACSDFVKLIDYELDAMCQPLKEDIKLLESKIAEYDHNVSQIAIEINRRYNRDESKN